MSRRIIDAKTLERWVRAGILHLPRRGSGYRHRIPDAERRAIIAVDSVRRLARVTPKAGEGYTPQVRALMVAAANAARSNPPGTVVELPSKSPHVRHVLVVPDEKGGQ